MTKYLKRHYMKEEEFLGEYGTSAAAAARINLKEALELHFEPPQATRPPKVRTIEVEVGAA